MREPVNVITHFTGAILSLVGVVWLASLSHRQLGMLVAILIYGGAMFLTYLASTAMHFHHGRWHRLLQRFDHAAIYLMIAGTYTPIGYHLLEGKMRWILLGSVWAVALAGAFTKVFFFWKGNLSTLMYVLLGGLPTPLMWPVLQTGFLLLLLGGGVIYVVGAVIYALEKPNFHRHFGHHELWHVFVMAGSAFHFFAVFLYVVPS